MSGPLMGKVKSKKSLESSRCGKNKVALYVRIHVAFNLPVGKW